MKKISSLDLFNAEFSPKYRRAPRFCDGHGHFVWIYDPVVCVLLKPTICFSWRGPPAPDVCVCVCVRENFPVNLLTGVP